MKIKFDLNGLWEYSFDEDNQGTAQQWEIPDNLQFIDTRRYISIPGDIQFNQCSDDENIVKNDDKRIIWFFKEFVLPKDYNNKRANIVFEHVDGSIDIFLDGKHIGSNEYGFYPAQFDVSGIYPDEYHLLVIKVENPKGNAGIQGNVYLEFTDWIYIDELNIETELNWRNTTSDTPTPKLGKIKIKTYMKNKTDNDWNGQIEYSIIKNHVELINSTRDFNIQKQNTRLLTEVIQIESPELWVPRNNFENGLVSIPEIYLLRITIQDQNDEIISIENYNFGFCEIENTDILKKELESIQNREENSVSEIPIKVNQKPFELRVKKINIEENEFGKAFALQKLINLVGSLKSENINCIMIDQIVPWNRVFEICDLYGIFCIIDSSEQGKWDMNNAKTQELMKKIKERYSYHPSLLI